MQFYVDKVIKFLKATRHGDKPSRRVYWWNIFGSIAIHYERLNNKHKEATQDERKTKENMEKKRKFFGK